MTLNLNLHSIRLSFPGVSQFRQDPKGIKEGFTEEVEGGKIRGAEDKVENDCRGQIIERGPPELKI